MSESEARPSRTTWFSALSLRWQIGLFTVTLLVISLLAFGSLLFHQSADTVTTMALDRVSLEARRAADEIDRRLNEAASTALQIRHFPPIPGVLRAIDNGGADSEDPSSTTEIWLGRLATIVASQMETQRQITACMLIGEKDDVLLRVTRNADGEPQAETSATLARFARITAQAASKLEDGEVFISSPWTTNGKAVIDVAVPCFDASGTSRCVFVQSVDAGVLFKAAAKQISSGTLDIVDDEGHYVYSVENPEYANNGRLYAKDKPIRAALLEQPDGRSTYREVIPGSQRPDGVSLIASYHKLNYAPQDGQRFLVLAPSIETDSVLEPLDQLFRRFLLVGLLTSGITCLLTWMFSGRITSALQRLSLAADHIAAGNLDSEIPSIPGIGEVRSLAESVRTMTASLRRTAVAAEAHQRQTDSILNSTADGIITLDETGRVQSINKPAQTMFGYEPQEILGQDAGRLVPVLTSREESYEHAHLRPGEVRSLGTEADVSGLHRNGRSIPIALRVTEMEHLGQRQYIATVQDISARKAADAERSRLFDGIGEAVRQLATASNEILATTAQQARSAQEQAASVTETATTIEQLTQTAEQARGRADEVARSARQADEVSQTGRQAVDRTFEAMEQVRRQAESIAENILALAERAQAISEIISTVDDLADQTNLLALNASIEASRAGEHGKGFAVVATEIKALAEQSKKATEQVRHILGEIQQATNTAVISTEQGTRTVEDARAVVKSAEETINTLAETISTAARSASQIVASSGQQASAMQQINEAMSQIDQATRQTLSATRQAEQSAADLNTLGRRLQDLIEGNGHANGHT